MNQPAGPTPEPVHVWVSTTTDNPRDAAHHLLRQLANSLGHQAPLTHTPTGQPLIEGLHISLTHTTGVAAAVATHAGPVGIDAELFRDFPVAELSRRWFAPTEATNTPETFLHLWTAKEAVGKALGRGLRGNGLSRPMPPALAGGGGGKEPSAPEPIASGDGGVDERKLVAGGDGGVGGAGEAAGAVGSPRQLVAGGDRVPGEGGTLLAQVVPSEPEFAVVHVGVRPDLVLALAFPVGVTEVVLHHGTALRSTVRSRTSFPVVVRGS
ncbi:4'-phosphopantetheinyl transferase family protein [Kribbella sp. DT2]|uniref:4'-phosphopantetheinyl transferase family protein n=1 Tax=Kribbella sp. DT2 TaxID=3393427 RepID=UPI003CEC91D6